MLFQRKSNSDNLPKILLNTIYLPKLKVPSPFIRYNSFHRYSNCTEKNFLSWLCGHLCYLTKTRPDIKFALRCIFLWHAWGTVCVCVCVCRGMGVDRVIGSRWCWRMGRCACQVFGCACAQRRCALI